jgi:hypothetical protein
VICPDFVYALGESFGAAWRIDGRVGTATLKESVILAVTVNVISGDLSRGVDALHEGVDAAWRVDRRVDTAGVQEALKVAAAILDNIQQPVPSCLRPSRQ